tara:strand:- start:200 stop:427 length:228 start_codon:yes stop_codon:yes gene_type:complete
MDDVEITEAQTAKLIVELLFGLEHVTSPDKIIEGVTIFISMYYKNTTYSLDQILNKILENKAASKMVFGDSHGEA